MDSPRGKRSFDNFQKLKWLPIDQIFKLNKLGLLNKVVDGRAPEYLITMLGSLWFEHKISKLPEQKHYTAYRNPEPNQWGEHSSIPLL